MNKFGLTITVLLVISLLFPAATNFYMDWKQRDMIEKVEHPIVTKPATPPITQEKNEITPEVAPIKPAPNKPIAIKAKPEPKPTLPIEIRKKPPVPEPNKTEPVPRPTPKIVYLLEIPALNLKRVISEGSNSRNLRNGPSHMVESAAYGETGICLIAGHRTTYGAPFRNVDRLIPGDKILIRNQTVSYEYVVQDQYIVDSGYKLDFISDIKELYLSTCHPPHSAKNRLLIRCRLE